MADSAMHRDSLTKGSTEYHDDILCGPCRSRNVKATGYCTDCVENLCEVCFDYHLTIKVFISHTLLPEPRHVIVCNPCSRGGKNVQSSGFCLDCKDSLCLSCFDYHQRPSATREHRLINKPKLLKKEIQDLLASNTIPKGPKFSVPSLTAETIDMCAPCSTKDKHLNAFKSCPSCNENLCSECDQYHRQIKYFQKHSIRNEILFWCKPCARRSQRVNTTGFCNDCQEHLCYKCCRYHNFPTALKKHQLLSLNKSKPLKLVYPDSRGMQMNLYHPLQSSN